MTLTEFLLARYAEEFPERVHDEGFDPSPYYEGTYRHAGTCATVGSYDSPDCDCGGAAWTIADLEAKRRIVEDAIGPRTSGPELEWVVRVLAAVYADHPDYNPEWRP